MLRPAAVTAAAVWLLLSTGLASSDFTLCSHCFYRQSPPEGSSDRPLQPLCLTRSGQTFATLYQPDCSSPVYTAFILRNEPPENTDEDVPQSGSEEKESVSVVVPALLRGEVSEVPQSVSLLQQWDSDVAALVRSKVVPQCHSLGGDLYVVIGAGRLGPLGDGAEECQTKPLWSAACCAAPEGMDSFSVAFIRDTEGEQREVTVEELLGLLEVTELFSGRCGGDGQNESAFMGTTSASPRVAASEVVSEDVKMKKVISDSSDQTVSSKQAATDSEEKALVAESAESSQISADSNEDSEVSSSGDSSTSEAQTVAEPSSPSSETVEEQDTDDNSTSTLLYILSTTLSILKAPLHPVVSTITQLPGQISYVLQEDLGVLTALPGDTLSVFYLLVSDVFSWICSVVNLVLGVGEAIFSRIYFLTSSMGDALLCSCCTGITGMGTLAGDTVGIFGGVLNNTWWVTKFFGGPLVEQSGGYVGTVVGELGCQASAVVCGAGKLAWKIGGCIWKFFKFGWRIVTGILNIVLAILDDAFFDQQQQQQQQQPVIRNEETVDTSVL